MSLIAEFRLFNPNFPLMDSLSTVPDMQLRVEQAIAEHSEQPILFLWANGDDFETFESALASDRTVEDSTRIEDTGDRRLYRVQVTERSEMVLYPAELEAGTSRLSVLASEDGVKTRMRLPDRRAIRQFRKICDEYDVSLSLQGLYEDDGSTRIGRYGLSPKQQTALQKAMSRGYYTVPRTITLEDLARELDISRQAASERLRRGCHLLIKNTLGGANSNSDT
ncbi:bacterio-opsin activator domain-containing protein [Halocatena pleomorpha]|uniref:Helix-turn-helix domain-containing protein n=1 Tax=Halocatena pleomorpha TaxID=1785090 RepID=A0A3P3R699_9EURY|nr:bacterio-opsin activator domain-containing protein [Halocatena pleomorpha]RRJ28160.1 helix-turn-helix domain-containing protein [Halocatena pleomorpha]